MVATWSSLPMDAPRVLGIQSSTVGLDNLLKPRPTADFTILNPIADPIARPIRTGTQSAPSIIGQSAIVLDRVSRTPLYEKNTRARKFPASTTKIVTSAIVIEEMNLYEVVTVPDDLFDRAAGSWMGLSPGDTLTRLDLLWGTLLNSGNDAAYVLAATNSGGFDDFIARMNRLVNQLNLTNTHLDNSIGYDNDQHFTTAFDLAFLADHALQLPLFQEIVATRSRAVVVGSSPGREIILKNTHPLLGIIEGVKGIKTGSTEAARGVLVTLVERDGHEIIVVVMASEDRGGDTVKLIEWVYGNYEW